MSLENNSQLRKWLVPLAIILVGSALLLAALYSISLNYQVAPFVIGFTGLLVIGSGVKRISELTGNLWKPVLGFTILWFGLLIVALNFQPTSVQSPIGIVIGLSLLLTWILLPITIYLDATYIRESSEWSPWWPIYVIVSLIPPLNPLSGVIYLLRRHQTTGEP